MKFTSCTSQREGIFSISRGGRAFACEKSARRRTGEEEKGRARCPHGGIAHVHVKDGVHCIEGMCVKDTHRHRGLCSEMLHLITSELAGAHARTAVLRDVQTHDRVVMFYKQRGFVENASTPTHTTLDFCE